MTTTTIETWCYVKDPDGTRFLVCIAREGILFNESRNEWTCSKEFIKEANRVPTWFKLDENDCILTKDDLRYNNCEVLAAQAVSLVLDQFPEPTVEEPVVITRKVFAEYSYHVE